tara:strand:+ start:6556 stop:7014 length:459 start_codon:yes stop_codon:yes gene_type:complete
MPPFRPFKPGEFVENDGSNPQWPKGTQSTERAITWQMPDGRWVNTPTLFQTPNGVVDMSAPASEEQARGAAMALMRSGYSFPIYGSEDDAVRGAIARSSKGGAFQGSIGKPRETSDARTQGGLAELLSRPRAAPPNLAEILAGGPQGIGGGR